MRVLLLNQFFLPDSAATGQLLGDLALDLAKLGCSVEVVCGRGEYAGSDLGGSLEVFGERGGGRISVFRVGGVSFGRSASLRLVSYLQFLLSACLVALRRGRAVDVVISLTTPPGLSFVGHLVKWWCGARHFIWEMDLYPDVAVDVGVMRAGSVATWVIGWALDYPRRRADGVIALGECMAARLAGRKVARERIHVCENWADGLEIVPLPFPEGPLTVLYSGNLGLAHDVETLQEAMRRLAIRRPAFSAAGAMARGIESANGSRRNRRGIRFVFAGGGPRRKAMEEFCRKAGIGNVEFRGYAPRSGLGESLSEGHIGLVTQRPETVGSVVPSKVYGIMAAGRPVLYIGPRTATPAGIIERFRCGWQVDPGDVEGLAALLAQLAANSGLVHEAGRRAREAFLKHYDRPIGVARVAAVILGEKALASEKASAASAS